MYGYIYDIFVNQPQHEKEVIKIENTLTDLGLQGQTYKLKLFNNVPHAIEDLLQRGVKTLVAVGSDQLFSRILDFADLFDKVTLGLIPLGNHQMLGNMFGIPHGEKACYVLSARLLEKLALARINQGYFLHSVHITDPRVQIKCDRQYVISSMSNEALITILNPHHSMGKRESSDRLSVTVAPKTEKNWYRKNEALSSSQITCELIQAEEPRNVLITVDGQKQINTPVEIQLSSRAVSIIMGKERSVI